MTESEDRTANRPGFWNRLHRAVVAIEPWSILVAVVALLLTVLQFWIEYRDRVNERVVRAWTLVTTAAPGSSGKKEALEYLNRQDGWLCFEEQPWEGCAVLLKSRSPLVGINLSEKHLGEGGAFLGEINLPEANLFETNFSGANLVRANFSGANLLRANFSGASLIGANLSEARLRSAILLGANLSGANLSGANLLGAIFSGADLSGANLSRANQLSQRQIAAACALPDNPPSLPLSLTWNERPCR